jgi:hypothetical protein
LKNIRESSPAFRGFLLRNRAPLRLSKPLTLRRRACRENDLEALARFIFRSSDACFSPSRLGNTKEKTMLSTKLAGCSLAAVAGVAMLALSMGPASAFTLTSPSLEHSYSAAQVQKVWWDRWGRWHGARYWGRRCWRGYYGRLHCN